MLDSTQNNHLIQALFNLPDRIRNIIEPMPNEMLEWRPNENAWSIQMVLAHLLHCETYFQNRLEKIVTEVNPTIAGFGPEEAIPDSKKLVCTLLDEFKAARQQTLDQIYTYSQDDWERPAIHSVMGPTTLKEQIQNIVNHDTEHLGQIFDMPALWQTENNHH